MFERVSDSPVHFKYYMPELHSFDIFTLFSPARYILIGKHILEKQFYMYMCLVFAGIELEVRVTNENTIAC